MNPLDMNPLDMNPLEFRSRQAIELVTVPVNEVSDTCPVSLLAAVRLHSTEVYYWGL